MVGFPCFHPTNRNMFALPIRYMHSENDRAQTVFAEKIVCTRESSRIACNLAFFITVHFSWSNWKLWPQHPHCAPAGPLWSWWHGASAVLCLHEHFQQEVPSIFILISTALSDAVPGEMERDLCGFPLSLVYIRLCVLVFLQGSPREKVLCIL